MSEDLLTSAAEAAENVRNASHGRALAAAVQEFLRVLKTVPDFGARELPRNIVPALASLADQTIEHIERQIDTGSNRASARRDLAQAIYDIRAALEEADRFSRHYAG